MENQLGARIAKLRRACGLTQETLGGQLGVSAAAVSKWETGAAHSERYSTKYDEPTLIHYQR